MTDSNPPHPGIIVRARCLEPNGLSVKDGARLLGVTRQALNNLVNGKAGISPEMAVRLSRVFGGEDERWLRLQLDFDLAQARKRVDSMNLPCAAGLPHPKKEMRPL
ncbi:MAG: addiction module antidote protein, HigA family [Hyphomicrobium sp.]|nr:addiction module antidote protein, HigA family [Hyphomicrobium sp.]